MSRQGKGLRASWRKELCEHRLSSGTQAMLGEDQGEGNKWRSREKRKKRGLGRGDQPKRTEWRKE